MTLEEQVMEALKTAMREKNTLSLNALRSIKSAIQIVRTDGSGQVIDAAKEMQIVQKLVKQRRDSLSIFEQQGREDLALIERGELVVLERFLPAMLSESELRAEIQAIITQKGAMGPKDMGKVMGTAVKSLQGKAEGGSISAMVKQLLVE